MEIDLHQSTGRGDIITLLEPLEILFDGKYFIVPAGFESDGVSTPEFLWATISPAVDPRTLRAGIAHDYIYRVQPPEWTREDADKMFYRLCREDGLGWWRSWKAYRGLRRFGGAAWEANNK